MAHENENITQINSNDDTHSPMPIYLFVSVCYTYIVYVHWANQNIHKLKFDNKNSKCSHNKNI